MGNADNGIVVTKQFHKTLIFSFEVIKDNLHSLILWNSEEFIIHNFSEIVYKW